MKKRAWLAATGAALCAAVCTALAVALPAAAAAPTAAHQPQARHVVVVGISGLTWATVSQTTTPELWRLAAAGSVGALVDYAEQPLACPADGWLTLNSAARAQGPRPCTELPAVTAQGTSAQVAAMPQLIKYNQQFDEAPDWGLLASSAACATAVGPGAALALAAPSGHVASYVPSAADLSRSVLARCPLTVVDLGQIQSQNPSSNERPVLSLIQQQLAALVADLPPSTLLIVTAPGAAAAPGQASGSRQASGSGENGAPAGPPHLMSVVVSGPGFADGLLSSAATRRPGIVALTDLTPTVASWLGRPVPAGTVGSVITATSRGGLDATVDGLRARDTAEQVWITTHGWFYLGYAAAGALAFGVTGLLLWGATEERRRRRARCWRVAGVAATAVPLASYLADAAPWWTWAHPAWWLYGLTVAWTLAITAAALPWPWLTPSSMAKRLGDRRVSDSGGYGGSSPRKTGRMRARYDGGFCHRARIQRRSALGPFGAIATATLVVLGLDVMTGSRLQLDAPFGLSLLVSGRYFGIGNEALGVYCVSTLVAATWLASLPQLLSQHRPFIILGTIPGIMRFIVLRGPVLTVGLVGLFAVIASGWPGFGAKVGGTIALVPCLLLLAAWLGGVRVGRRWVLPVALSGVVVFLAFAVLSYFLPAAGVSDMGTFAGNLLHGHAGAVLQRKVSANVGSLTLNVAGWLIPVAAVAAGAALWRPEELRLRTLATAFTALPVLRTLAWLCWLVLVLGWFADDSGVLVPAVALPFVIPLTAAMAASVSVAEVGAGYFDRAFAGPSVAGRPPK